VVVARLEIPAQNLPGGTAKYYEVLSQGSQWTGRDLNQAPSGYKSKLIVKNFPTFYGSQRFITVFTRACPLSLLWTKLIWSLSCPVDIKN
jgi:hypothetical protein